MLSNLAFHITPLAIYHDRHFTAEETTPERLNHFALGPAESAGEGLELPLISAEENLYFPIKRSALSKPSL